MTEKNPISLFDESTEAFDQVNEQASGSSEESYEDAALGLFEQPAVQAGEGYEASAAAPLDYADLTAEHPAITALTEAQVVSDSQLAEHTITALASLVANARNLPLSKRTAMIKRDQIEGLIADLQGALPADLAVARSIVAARDDMYEDARREVDRMLESARVEQSRLVSEHEVSRAAHAEAEETRRELEAECERMRRQTDAYVAAKLAAYEDSLNRALEVVQRGRTRFGGYVPVPAEEVATEAAPISRIPRSA